MKRLSEEAVSLYGLLEVEIECCTQAEFTIGLLSAREMG
jgi:hypothetical protein